MALAYVRLIDAPSRHSGGSFAATFIIPGPMPVHVVHPNNFASEEGKKDDVRFLDYEGGLGSERLNVLRGPASDQGSQTLLRTTPQKTSGQSNPTTLRSEEDISTTFDSWVIREVWVLTGCMVCASVTGGVFRSNVQKPWSDADPRGFVQQVCNLRRNTQTR